MIALLVLIVILMIIVIPLLIAIGIYLIVSILISILMILMIAIYLPAHDNFGEVCESKVQGNVAAFRKRFYNLFQPGFSSLIDPEGMVRV
jgi:hypothetical protein